MRALATFIFACLLCASGDTTDTHYHNPLPPLTKPSPIGRIVNCTRTLGFPKCMKALTAWCAQNAIETFRVERDAFFSLSDDVERFPWEKYTQTTDEQLDLQLCDSTEELLRYRSLRLDYIPGYLVALQSKGNGTLTVDLLANDQDDATGRSKSKKMQKQFYRILPMLMVPGLIMSAILPFVLPALKMMTMAAVMINNMAFTGAAFTLLRNNAFSDHYEKKIVYANHGYQNEKRTPYYAVAESHIIRDNAEPPFTEVHTHDFGNFQSDFEEVPADEYPSNSELLTQYYGENPKNVNSLQEKSEKRIKRRKSARRKNRVKKRVRT